MYRKPNIETIHVISVLYVQGKRNVDGWWALRPAILPAVSKKCKSLKG